MTQAFDPTRQLGDWLAHEASTVPVPELAGRVDAAVARRRQRPAPIAAATSPWPSRWNGLDGRRVLAWAIVVVLLAAVAGATLIIGSRIISRPSLPLPVQIVRGSDLTTARSGHAGVSLADGRVAVFGGGDASNGSIASIASIETWGPAGGAWQAAGSLSSGRDGVTATRLPNGQVLVAGGAIHRHVARIPTDIAELWDPGTGEAVAEYHLAGPRADHFAVGLPDGTVLLFGGIESASAFLSYGQINGGAASAQPAPERLDPASGTSMPLGLRVPGQITSAVSLPDGRILLVGLTDANDPVSWAVAYDPRTGATVDAPGLSDRVTAGQTVTAIPDGRVVLIGGARGPSDPLSATVQVFDPVTGRFNTTGRLAAPRTGHVAVATPDGRVVVV